MNTKHNFNLHFLFSVKTPVTLLYLFSKSFLCLFVINIFGSNSSIATGNYPRFCLFILKVYKDIKDVLVVGHVEDKSLGPGKYGQVKC